MMMKITAKCPSSHREPCYWAAAVQSHNMLPPSTGQSQQRVTAVWGGLCGLECPLPSFLLFNPLFGPVPQSHEKGPVEHS